VYKIEEFRVNTAWWYDSLIIQENGISTCGVSVLAFISIKQESKTFYLNSVVSL